VVVYEDSDLRGRRSGEMRQLVTTAMRKMRPGILVEHADGPEAALRRAVAMADGGPVLFLYEKLPAARDALAAVGAHPVPESAPAGAENGAEHGAEPPGLLAARPRLPAERPPGPRPAVRTAPAPRPRRQLRQPSPRP